jgi:tetratricopeptide (TPR) repeat protein
LGNLQQFQYYSALAKEKDYDTETEESLQQLINMYFETGNYPGLAETYPKLIQITKDKKEKAQLFASLAFVYKELGEIEKARESALKALELLPEAKADVEAFLRSLGQ